jgi:hypothetical protein
MKKLNVEKCGISNWAQLIATEDGGCLIKRISEYWLKRLPNKIAGVAKSPAGIKLDFKTDTRTLIFNYSYTAHNGKYKTLSIFIDGNEYEYTLYEAKNKIKFDFETDNNKHIVILLPL